MPEFMSNPAFHTYALCSALLVMNLLFLAGYTGGLRTKYKNLINPEDPGFSEQPEHPIVARAFRAHRNAIENLLPFFPIGFLYVVTGATPFGAQAYFYVFTAARLLHSVVYLLEKQPWRTIFFAIAALSVFGMAIQVLLKTV